jgi:hypothetical protein
MPRYFGNVQGPTCPAGYKWNPDVRRCVLIGGPEDPDSPKKDVVVRPPDPQTWIPVDEFYWDRFYGWLLETGSYAKRLFNVDLVFTRQRHTLSWGKDPNTGLNYFETFTCKLEQGEVPSPPGLYRASKGNPYMAAQFLARDFQIFDGPIFATEDLPQEQ